MKVFITGGSGFIGTNLVEDFSENGCEVLNFDSVEPRNIAQKKFWKKGDLRDGTVLRLTVREFSPDVIIHMAARTDLNGRSIDDYESNTVGVENLIAAIEDLTTLQRVIFASSRLVCRIGYMPKNEVDYCPTTPYGESKVLGEKIVREAASRIPCPWLIVRPTSIWGPWFDVPYKTFFLTVARGRYVHPGTERILKSFGFIGNTVYELQKLLVIPADSISGKTLYLADYPPINVSVMANSIQSELSVKPIRTVNVKLLRFVAWVGDFLKFFGWQNPPLTSFRLNNLLTPMVHDMKPLSDNVGDLPYSMESGIKITVAWLKSNKDVV